MTLETSVCRHDAATGQEAHHPIRLVVVREARDALVLGRGGNRLPVERVARIRQQIGILPVLERLERRLRVSYP